MYRDLRMWSYLARGVWQKGGREAIRAWRKRCRAKQAYHLIIRTRRGNAFVGEIAIHSLSWSSRYGELGYHIERTQWGHGYATEAAAALVRWSFERARLHRLEAVISEGHRASARVLRKLGFRREGRRPERVLLGKRWAAELEFGLLASDFRRRAGKRIEVLKNVRSQAPRKPMAGRGSHRFERR
jgi:RimJ/RimL family protein N-acetyltransferase